MQTFLLITNNTLFPSGKNYDKLIVKKTKQNLPMILEGSDTPERCISDNYLLLENVKLKVHEHTKN